MRSIPILLTACLLTALGGGHASAAPPDGDESSVASLSSRVSALLPRPEEERWRKIPWRTDLLEARREANRTGRPIFMWLMNGNPLACT